MRPCSWLVAALLVGVTGVASAEPSAPAAPAAGEVHDGFYLRFAGGPAWLDVSRATEHSGGTATLAYLGESSAVSTWLPSAEVSVGGTPIERLVVAGTVLVGVGSAPELVVGGGQRAGLSGPLLFGLVAPTVDVFPNPLGGLHVGGGAGVAMVTVRVRDPLFRAIGGVGAGFTAHVGYDWWTRAEWSVGMLLRGTVAVIGSEQEHGGVTGREHDTVTSLAVAATLLYH